MTTHAPTSFRLGLIEILALALLCGASIIAAILASPPFLFGLLGGGLVATLNVYLLRQLLAAIIRTQRTKQALLAGLLAAKFGLLAAVIYVMLTRLPVDPLGLLAGISIVVLAIVAAGLRAALAASADSPAEASRHG